MSVHTMKHAEDNVPTGTASLPHRAGQCPVWGKRTLRCHIHDLCRPRSAGPSAACCVAVTTGPVYSPPPRTGMPFCSAVQSPTIRKRPSRPLCRRRSACRRRVSQLAVAVNGVAEPPPPRRRRRAHGADLSSAPAPPFAAAPPAPPSPTRHRWWWWWWWWYPPVAALPSPTPHLLPRWCPSRLACRAVVGPSVVLCPPPCPWRLLGAPPWRPRGRRPPPARRAGGRRPRPPRQQWQRRR